MNIKPISDKYQADWLRMRQNLYTDIDQAFHKEEMILIRSSKDFHCLIVEQDQKAIGFIELSLRNIVDGAVGSPVGYIEGLYLDASFRDQGYGKALIEQAILWFKSKGCKQMATDTEIENTSAQNYYEKLGFSKKWTIVQYLKDID